MEDGGDEGRGDELAVDGGQARLAALESASGRRSGAFGTARYLDVGQACLVEAWCEKPLSGVKSCGKRGRCGLSPLVACACAGFWVVLLV